MSKRVHYMQPFFKEGEDVWMVSLGSTGITHPSEWETVYVIVEEGKDKDHVKNVLYDDEGVFKSQVKALKKIT